MASNSTGVWSANRGVSVAKSENARSKQIATDEKTRHEQERINRKREQNRISQQCLRERQQAHSKQLETLASIMKTSTDENVDHGSLRATLMNNQLALIEENNELREALLRMRKKILSLSAASSAIADDPIFEKLVSKTGQKSSLKRKAKNISGQSTTFTPGPALDVAEDIDKVEAKPENVKGQGSSYDDNAAPRLQRQKHQDLDGMSFSPLPENNFTSDSLESLGASAWSSNFSPPTPCRINALNYNVSFVPEPAVNSYKASSAAEETHDRELCFVEPTLNSANWATDFNIHSAYEFVPQSLQYQLQLSEQPKKWSPLRQTSIWKVEEACLWYLMEELDLRGHEVASGLEQLSSSYDFLRAEIACLDSSYPIVANLAKIGISMICKTSGLANYLYGVGANESMEKVLLWRLAPSLSNRAAIAEPFKPTPLQYMRTDYSVIINFINWPSIRDQLIHKQGTYELAEVTHSIVMHTVIEFPELHAAINIHDAFITKVLSHAVSSLETSHAEAKFDDAFVNDGSIGNTGWGTEEVFQSIKQTMQQMPNVTPYGSWKSATTARDLIPSNRLLQVADKQPLSSRWGLDNLDRWKLSKEFGMAHPWLDCTSVTASYPMYSSRILPEM